MSSLHNATYAYLDPNETEGFKVSGALSIVIAQRQPSYDHRHGCFCAGGTSTACGE
jgi:hypothetical protein